VATLYPCMPEVAVDLAAYLKQDFRYQLRKKDQMKVEAKNKVYIIYLDYQSIQNDQSTKQSIFFNKTVNQYIH
jgi:hypothetical protein